MFDKLKKLSTKKKALIGVSFLSLVSLIYLYSATQTKKTSPLPSPLPETAIPTFSQEGLQQTQNDYEFGQIVKSEVEKLPFLTSLPIITNNYIVLYDFEKRLVRVDLSPSVTQKQVEDEIKTKLTQIGVDLKKIPLRFSPALSGE